MAERALIAIAGVVIGAIVGAGISADVWRQRLDVGVFNFEGRAYTVKPMEVN